MNILVSTQIANRQSLDQVTPIKVYKDKKHRVMSPDNHVSSSLFGKQHGIITCCDILLGAVGFDMNSPIAKIRFDLLDIENLLNCGKAW